VVEGAYLALVSDQPCVQHHCWPLDLGMPDWREAVAGQAMTSQDITDVVAWLASTPSASSRSALRRWPGPLETQVVA